VTRPKWIRPFVLALIALAVASSCRGNRSVGKRVVILGFDGMDYRVTRDLMAAGRMPNFSRLAASGVFAPLATSTPAQSPVAWSSFITGMDPGGHGIFDFVHRDPKTMLPYLSTTRTGPPRTLSIGSWQFPISRAEVTLSRRGQPFWDVLEQQGIRTTIIRMPANFPPSGTARRELSGMGTPDLLGTYGTFTFFSSAPVSHRESASSGGGRVYPVDVIENVVHAALHGPDHPYRRPARQLSVPLTVYLDPQQPAGKIVVGDEERVLKAGEWTDWVPIEFPLLPLQSLRGICRFYLKQVRPTFELYVSPINLDPGAPAMPISTPASYAADLAHAHGPFYTQGLAEETKALNDHLLTRAEFLRQAAIVGDEITEQYWSILDDFTDGVLFYYFGKADQVSHMMWRSRDPSHPAYVPETDRPYATVVDDVYVSFDQIVGETLHRVGPDTVLIVMSDHGFASWRRSVHLNSWLRDRGYLAVVDPTVRNDPGLFQNVDWSRTRAYGLGLNGLYINVRGRERWGIVPPEHRAALAEDIRRELTGLIDPATGSAAVTKVYPREQIYKSAAFDDVAPDLVVGYAEGIRVSNESALGGVPPGIIVDNTAEWSGDHSMDPEAVPGIFLSNRRLAAPGSIDKVAAIVLVEFGIKGFPVAARAH